MSVRIRKTGAASNTESMLSRTPPRPGTNDPESLMPVDRLSIDSIISPTIATVEVKKAIMSNRGSLPLKTGENR